MVISKDTVKERAAKLLEEIMILDQSLTKMLHNVQKCRNQCLQAAETFDCFNEEIKNHKMLGEA